MILRLRVLGGFVLRDVSCRLDSAFDLQLIMA